MTSVQNTTADPAAKPQHDPDDIEASKAPLIEHLTELRTRLTAPSAHPTTQDLYVSEALKTGRVMVKDEDLCLHCSLCAERCPTGAWDMQKFLFDTAKAGCNA